MEATSTTQRTASASAVKRAFNYLRVSSKGQVETDFVIVWKLDRWARNVVDHFQTRELVREAGAELVSITEPMIGEDTPESFYMEGMFAVQNQYESMKTARNVRGGLYQKAKVGGTYGRARLGYRNLRDPLPGSRGVASVTLDHERRHFLTTGFQLYDSGQYSIPQLVEENVQQRAAAIEALAATSQQAIVQVREAKTALIAKLKAQQVRLLRLHLEGDEASPDAFRDERVRLQTEIAAAEESLAETETRLHIDSAQLRMALELAEDVAAVYAAADEGVKRSLNQAFFAKVYVMPEWDEDSRERQARVAGADLTEPYATLLANGLVEAVLAEAEAIRSASGRAEDASDEAPSAVSIFLQMVGEEGLEPSRS